jgi:glyoxylase-like metal-dependent hydrolase (beta-lactamase superfamily II)
MQTDRESHREVLSRRGLFASLGLGATTLALGGSSLFAQDAAPTTAPAIQGAGFFRFKLGTLTATQVSDGGFVMDPSQIFPKIDPAELEAVAKAVHISPKSFPGQVGVLLIENGTDRAIIDTGCGRAFGPATGFLQQNLRNAGLSAADITHVVISHAHPDHVGGLLNPEGKPAFPNARVYVNRVEHDFWTDAPDLSGMAVPDEMKKMVISTAQTALAGVKGKLELVKPGDMIAGVIEVIDAPGHTPGHVAFKVASGDEAIYHLGDCLHVLPLQLKHPEWHPAFDSDPERAVVTRRAILDRVAAEAKLVTGVHVPFPSVGYIDAEAPGYRWTPKPWTW